MGEMISDVSYIMIVVIVIVIIVSIGVNLANIDDKKAFCINNEITGMNFAYVEVPGKQTKLFGNSESRDNFIHCIYESYPNQSFKRCDVSYDYSQSHGLVEVSRECSG